MQQPVTTRKIVGALAAGSLLFISAPAAAQASVRAGDHVVSATLIASASSQAAVCTAGAASAAAAGAAAAAQVPAQPGCVLPVVDAAPTPVAEAPPPAVYVPQAEARGGIGILPLLLGLAAVAGLAWLLLDDDDEGEGALSPG